MRFGRVLASIWEGFGTVWGLSWELLGASWRIFEPSNSSFCKALAQNGLPEAFGVDFGGVWEGIWEDLGGSWEDFGQFLDEFWKDLGQNLSESSSSHLETNWDGGMRGAFK